MIEKSILLSIYIATYNRKEIIKESVQNILSIQSNCFNIWVLDDCSDDGTYAELSKIRDSRLHLISNVSRQGCLKDGAMPNWYRLLEEVDGVFALHLNDRDLLCSDKLIQLIAFLDEHRYYTGGICDSFTGIHFYPSPEQSFLSVPYRAAHPSGVIIRTDLYRSILERKSFFTKEKAYIHPHDLILGVLSQKGNMFEFHKIYNLGNTDSFANNKSFLYKKGDARSSWFSPKERTNEFKLFIDHLSTLSFCDDIKKQKAVKVAKSYLYFCTFNYKYYVTDKGQTLHYGIDKESVSIKELTKEMRIFVDNSSHVLQKYALIDSAFTYRVKMHVYYWKIFLGKPLWDLYKKGTHRKW